MKQTAVEWIIDTIGEKNMGDFLRLVIEKAKQMEHEQFEKLRDFEYWKEWK